MSQDARYKRWMAHVVATALFAGVPVSTVIRLLYTYNSPQRSIKDLLEWDESNEFIQRAMGEEIVSRNDWVEHTDFERARLTEKYGG